MVTSITRYCMTLCNIVKYMVTSVTWWLPVVTMCYQHYQVLHVCCVLLSQLLGGYLWLPLVTGVALPGIAGP